MCAAAMQPYVRLFWTLVSACAWLLAASQYRVPTNSAAITTMLPHCDSVEASYWSRSLESDATVRADYALTTTTMTTSQYECNRLPGKIRAADVMTYRESSPPGLTASRHQSADYSRLRTNPSD